MAVYKIKDIEILTGIKAHTLRIWEKRYEIMVPERTDTKIRTYDDDDLLLILNIALLNNNGFKISKIAQLTNDEIREKCKELTKSTDTDTAFQQLLLALMEMDERMFRKVLDGLIEKHGVISAYRDFIVRFLDRIGLMWQVGTINPAQEHFISNLIRQRILFETEKLDTPDHVENPVLLYLPEHEWHEIGLLLYNYFLRSKGIYTVYLGQSVPYSALFESIEKIKPEIAITSWLVSVEDEFIDQYFTRFKRDFPSIKMCVSGYQFTQMKNLAPKGINIFHKIEDLDDLFKDHQSFSNLRVG